MITFVTVWYFIVHLIDIAFRWWWLIDWWFSARSNINWQISWCCLSFFADRIGVSDSVIFDTGRLLKYQQHFIHIPDRQPDELKEWIHWWNFLKTAYLMTIQYREQSESIAISSGWNSGLHSVSLVLNWSSQLSCQMLQNQWVPFITHWLLLFLHTQC